MEKKQIVRRTLGGLLIDAERCVHTFEKQLNELNELGKAAFNPVDIRDKAESLHEYYEKEKLHLKEDLKYAYGFPDTTILEIQVCISKIDTLLFNVRIIVMNMVRRIEGEQKEEKPILSTVGLSEIYSVAEYNAYELGKIVTKLEADLINPIPIPDPPYPPGFMFSHMTSILEAEKQNANDLADMRKYAAEQRDIYNDGATSLKQELDEYSVAPELNETVNEITKYINRIFTLCNVNLTNIIQRLDKLIKTEEKVAMVSIEGLDKAEVLLALYNASHVQGMGFLAAVDHYGIEDARKDIEEMKTTFNGRLYFDYLHGRVIKTDISGDEFDPYLFDRDNGEGAAEKAIETLRNNGGKN